MNFKSCKAIKLRHFQQQGYLHTDHNDQWCSHGDCKRLVVSYVLPIFSGRIVKGSIGDEEKGQWGVDAMCHADEKFTLVKQLVQLSRFVELGIVHAVLVTHILSTKLLQWRRLEKLERPSIPHLRKQQVHVWAYPNKHYSLACFHSHGNWEDNQMIPGLPKRNLSLRERLMREHIALRTEPEFAPRSLASEWSFFPLLSCSCTHAPRIPVYHMQPMGPRD